MEPHLILYPSIAMVFLTLAVFFRLGLARYAAIHDGSVSIKFYRTFDEGDQPARLHLLGRHVQNHFEVPPLFHIGVLMVYATQTVSIAALAFAWSFFVLRCLHTAIHLGPNNVSVRFFTFAVSLLTLAGLWVCVLLGLAQTSA